MSGLSASVNIVKIIHQVGGYIAIIGSRNAHVEAILIPVGVEQAGSRTAVGTWYNLGKPWQSSR